MSIHSFSHLLNPVRPNVDDSPQETTPEPENKKQKQEVDSPKEWPASSSQTHESEIEKIKTPHSFPSELGRINDLFNDCLKDLKRLTIEQFHHLCVSIIKTYPLINFPSFLLKELKKVVEIKLWVFPLKTQESLSLEMNILYALAVCENSPFEQIEEIKEPLLKNQPAFFYLIKGLNKYKQGSAHQVEARAFFTQALETNPKCLLALYYRAESYRMGQQSEEAVKDLTQILEFDSQNQIAKWKRAAAYIASRQYELAVKDYSALISVACKEEDKYLCYIRIGNCCQQQKNLMRQSLLLLLRSKYALISP